VVDASELSDAAAQIEQSLREGRFARVDMGENTECEFFHFDRLISRIIYFYYNTDDAKNLAFSKIVAENSHSREFLQKIARRGLIFRGEVCIME
jgi:hypothetical protein